MKNKTIRTLHNQLINKEITVEQLVNEAINKDIALKEANATLDTNYKQALELAKEFDKSTIEPNQFLAGIPYSLKDNIITKDIITTGGSKLLSKYTPPYDAHIKTLLDQNKAILINKTNCDEFGFGGTGLASAFGPVINVDYPNRVVGGSSSGSALLVQQGVVPYAIATDTGDSIRRPASLLGICGYKPTYGIVSRYGVMPFSPSLDHVGILANDVADVAIVLDAIVQRDYKDSTSVDINTNFYDQLNSNQKYHFKIIKDIYCLFKPEYKLAFDQLIAELKANNHQVSFVEYDFKLIQAIPSIYKVIAYAEGLSSLSNLTNITFGHQLVDYKNYEDLLYNTRNQFFNSEIKKRLYMGAFVTQSNTIQPIFMNAKKMRNLIVEAINQHLNDQNTIFIHLTTNDVAETIEAVRTQQPTTNEITDVLQIANFSGLPSISIPFIKNESGHVGLNLFSKVFNDQEVLNAAYLIEQALKENSNE